MDKFKKNRLAFEQVYTHYNVYRYSLNNKPLYAGGMNENDVRTAVMTRFSVPYLDTGILIGRYDIHDPRKSEMITLDFKNFMRHRKLAVKTFYIEKYKNTSNIEISEVRDRIAQAKYFIDLLHKEDFKLIEILDNLEVESNKILKSDKPTAEEKKLLDKHIARITRDYNTGYYVANSNAYGVNNYKDYKALFDNAKDQLSKRLSKNNIQNCSYDNNFTLQERLDACYDNYNNQYCRTILVTE